MRGNKGLHLPNAGGREYTQTELSAVADLGAQSILILAFPNSPTQSARIDQEDTLCYAIGHRSPTVRVYADNILSRKPAEWSLECYILIRQYRARGLTPGLIMANELNIPGERGLPPETGWQEDWEIQIEWLRAFAEDFRQRSPNTTLHLPALSPGGDYLDGWTEYHRAGLHELFDFVDVHCYSLFDLAGVVAAKSYFGKPVIISEYNQVPVRDVLEEGVPSFYFLLSSDDHSFDRYSLLVNPSLYESFKNAKEETMPDYQVGPGILAAMAQHNEDPLEDEHYLGDRESYCASSEAIYVYSKGANRVARLPFV